MSVLAHVCTHFWTMCVCVHMMCMHLPVLQVCLDSFVFV